MIKPEWLLTEEDLDKLALDYPLLDFSFEDDYREEVKIMREAQLSKAAPLIAQAERERIIANALEVKVDTLRTDRAVVWFDLGYWQFLSGEKGE